jgi:hypothetical protein
MRFVIVGVALIGLAGCSSMEPTGVRECEESIKGKLRSPSTYKRIKFDVTPIDPANPSNIEKPTEVWVTVEYDAANAYGTPMRSTHMCKFPYKNGVADTGNDIDFDQQEAGDLELAADNLEAAADAAMNEVDNAAVQQ